MTLVELLTVLAIIGVLVGIAIPVVSAAKGRGQHTACAENLRQLGVGIVLYANDHDGWVPPATTLESAYIATGKHSPSAIAASPGVLRTALRSYLRAEATWFCPADPQRGRDVLWLGQRHLLTSYSVHPITEGQIGAWPPRMQIGRDPLSNKPEKSEDVPLAMDAAGIPRIDSDPKLVADDRTHSNHSDDLVNAVRHDLSLSRRPATYWLGSAK